jgi:hypothetical protein
MAHNSIFINRQSVSPWGQEGEKTATQNVDSYNGQGEFTVLSFQALRNTLLQGLGLTAEVSYEGEKNACYKIKSGFFNDAMIFISLQGECLHVGFTVINPEQHGALLGLSQGIEKKLSSGVQRCKVEVIFESRRI